MRCAKFFADDPEPEDDEIVTPTHLWYRDVVCQACMKEAEYLGFISRGDDAQPARFVVCPDHAANIEASGGQLVNL